MRQTRFIQALLLLIQASWVWLINQRVKRWVRAKGNTLKIATQNRNEHSRMVLSASNSDAITPRTAAGRKSSI